VYKCSLKCLENVELKNNTLDTYVTNPQSDLTLARGDAVMSPPPPARIHTANNLKFLKQDFFNQNSASRAHTKNGSQRRHFRLGRLGTTINGLQTFGGIGRQEVVRQGKQNGLGR
jgi:hypothetical protein